MERVDGYFVSDTGELFNTRAEALAAADDYDVCWAYETEPQWLWQ